MKHATRFTTLSLLALSLTACAVDHSDLFDDHDLRAVEIADAWDLHEPYLVPEFASCEDYWANRCAELTPEQCSIAQDRDACMPMDKEVVVYDVFAESFDTYEWTAISIGDQATSIGKDSAAAACETMAGLESEECLSLAAVAEQLASAGPELLEVFPEGGFAGLTIRDDILHIAPLEDAKTNLLFSAAGALGWAVPRIAGEHAIGHGNGVVEDDVIFMLSVRPNGSISVSSERAVFQQGPSEEARLRRLNPHGKVVFVSTRSGDTPQLFVAHVGATTPPVQLTHDYDPPLHPA